METLKMHAAVQLAVWRFMKQTAFFADYYEEIKLYFLHTYFYESLLFAVQRGFDIPMEMFRELRDTVKREIADYKESPYAAIIPKQMELYRLPEGEAEEHSVRVYLGQMNAGYNLGEEEGTLR